LRTAFADRNKTRYAKGSPSVEDLSMSSEQFREKFDRERGVSARRNGRVIDIANLRTGKRERFQPASGCSLLWLVRLHIGWR
jgi:hypothetical protein